MGYFRLILAAFVVVFHAWGTWEIPFGPPGRRFALYNFGGREAVGIFFIISGFYMSLILSDKYRGSLRIFYLNRFLRLFPTYWLVLALCLIFIPRHVAAIVEVLKTTATSAQAFFLFNNLFVFGSDLAFLVSALPGGLAWDPYTLSPTHNGSGLLVNMPIFTVGLELTFYLMAPFLVRSTRRAWVALALALAYHLAIVVLNRANIVYQYHLFPGCLLYFSLGILAHKIYSGPRRPLENRHYLAIVAAATTVLFIKPMLPNLLILIVPLVIPALFEATRSSRLDRFIGELSYPLYIVHYPVIKFFLERGIDRPNMRFLVLGTSLALALAIRLAFERPIERLRRRNLERLPPPEASPPLSG
jgi:peptidoglycan/LPS O-acetylase OafA/YrhL